MSKSTTQYINERKRKARLANQRRNAEANGGGDPLSGLGYVAGKTALGLGGVMEGITDIVSAGGHLLAGDTEGAAEQFKNNVMGDLGEELDAWYNPGGAMQFAGDVGQGIGQSTAFLLDLVVPGLGTGIFFAGTAGQGVSSAAAQTGKVGLGEVVYGASTAAIEAAVEKFVGGGGSAVKSLGSALGKGGGKALASVGKSATSSGFKTVLKETAKSAAGEFAEEALSEMIDPVLQRATKVNPNAEAASLGDIIYAGTVGAVSGGIMGGGASAINFNQTSKRGRAVRESGQVEGLLRRAELVSQTLGVATDAYKDKAKQDTTGRIERMRVRKESKRTQKHRENLLASVEKYRGLSEDVIANGGADALLGEIQNNTYYAVVSSQIDIHEQLARSMSDEAIAEFLQEINVDGKSYTVEDFRTNRDMIATEYATRLVMEEISQRSNVDTNGETFVGEEEVAEDTPMDADEVGEVYEAFKRGDTQAGQEQAQPSVSQNIRHTSTDAKGEVRYSGSEVDTSSSIAYVDGAPVVVLNLDSNIQQELANATPKERGKIVESYLRAVVAKAGSYTFHDGTVAVMDNADISKIGHTMYEVKNRAAVSMDDIVRVARYAYTKKNVEHKKFSTFKYYTAKVQVGTDIYEFEVNVGLGKFDNAYHIYDINQFENINRSGNPVQENPRKSVEQTVSRVTTPTDSIPHPDASVNPENEIRSEISTMGLDADYADLAVEAYRVGGTQGLSATTFARSFAMAVRMAEGGATLESLMKVPMVANLGNSTIQLAYEMGKKRAAPKSSNSGMDADFEGLVTSVTGETKKSSTSDGEGSRYSVTDEPAVVEIHPDEELTRRIQSSSKSKYAVIREYLIEKFYGQTFILSDGRKAIMDKRDAQELSHRANEHRTAQLGNLRQIIENATYHHSVYGVEHKKFDDFHYYHVAVRLNGEVFDLWLNVGTAKVNGTNHIYAITNKTEEAPTHYGVARPAGNALQNASSSTSIPHPDTSVNPQFSTKVHLPPSVAQSGLSSKQEATVRAAEVLAEVTGMDIYFFASFKQGNIRAYRDHTGRIVRDGHGKPLSAQGINGWYDPAENSLHIDLNGGFDSRGVSLFTLAHEVTHFVKDWSPEKFSTLVDFVLAQHATADGSRTLSRLYAKKEKMLRDRGLLDGKNATEVRDIVMEELVAESMESVLLDGKVIGDLAQHDKTLWEKIRDFIADIVAKIKRAYKGDLSDHEASRFMQEALDSLDEMQTLWREAVIDAGERHKRGDGVSRMNEGNMQVRYQAQPSKKNPQQLDPRTVTREDVRELLESVKRGDVYGNTYIPLRISTPAVLIEYAKRKRGDVIDNNPIAMSAEKAYQAMSQTRQGVEGRPHKLSVDNIIYLVEGMSDPAYIVYQSGNDRYVMVVEHIDADGKKAFAVVEIGEYKNPQHMNNYEGGLYNILVTAFSPDSGKLNELLNNSSNQVIYDKKKDAPQRSSSSMVPSLLNDTPFADSIPQNGGSVNSKYSLSEEDQQILFDEDFYAAFEGESREVIGETVEELERLKASEEFSNLTSDQAFDVNAKIKALKAGYQTLYDYYVGREKQRMLDEYRDAMERGRASRVTRLLDQKRATLRKKQALASDIRGASPLQNAQFEIIQRTNPMYDDYHVGIRSPMDIKTFTQVIDDPESFTWGDFTRDDAKKALERGTITIYSSYPIQNGVFVSTSYRQALEYAGGDPSGVHTKTVPLENVAWINGDEGQYADDSGKGGNIRYSFAEDPTDTAYNQPITVQDIQALRAIGRKSINAFISEDIQATQKWAYKFFRELGVKSPFFRAWFGDWRASQTKEYIPILSQVRTDGKNPRGIFKNNDTGWSISSSSVGYDETVSHSGKDKLSLIAMRNIDQIIENAVLLDTEISEYGRGKKSVYTAFMHKFYAIIRINGQVCIAKMAVDESHNPGHEETNKKFYHVRAIEIETVSTVGIDQSHTPIIADTASKISIADLFALVKRFDTEFSPKPVSRVVLNDDGTPKVFYHGTNAEWTEYDLAKNVNQVYGEGIYLTPDPNRARLYGDIVMPFYVKATADHREAKRTGKPHDYTYVKATGDIIVFSPTQIKSATDNIGTFDGSNPDIRYSFAGDSSATADKSLLTRAREMQTEGADSETIRRETGWFQGYDGKWRYEIDDGEMELDLFGRFSSNAEVREYRELMQRVYFDGVGSQADLERLRVLDNQFKGQDISPKTLGEIVRHTKLFEAYPQLRNMQLSLEQMDEGSRGYYEHYSRRIAINESLKSDPVAFKRTLIHEIQHAIQHIESFASGSSVEYFKNHPESRPVKPDDMEGVAQAQKKVDEIEAEFRRIWPRDSINLNLAKRYNILGDRWWDGNISKEEMAKIQEELEVIESSVIEAGWRDLFNRYVEATAELTLAKDRAERNAMTPMEAYSNTAGEIEARDVASRLHMTPEQRKNTRPDIDRLGVVFAGGGDTSFSIEREPNTGTSYVKIDVTDIQGDGIQPTDSLGRKARLYMRQKFNGIVLPLGRSRRAYIRKEGINEYTNPAKEMDNQAYRSKMLAATELDHLLQNATYLGWKSDDGRHPDVLRWLNYETIFVVSDENNQPRVFKGIVRIKRIARGDCFYDITKIEDITSGDIGQAIIKSAAESTSDVSSSSIPQSAPSVNSKYSLSENSTDPEIQGIEMVEEAERAVQADLEAENKSLREDVERLKAYIKLQRTVTGGTVFTKASIDRATGSIMRVIGAKRERSWLAQEISQLYAYMASAENLTYEDIMEKAELIADALIDKQPERRVQADGKYADILTYLRETPMSLSATQMQEVEAMYGSYENFRKRMFGKLRLSKTGTSLDIVWGELSGLYPEMFSADMNEADMVDALVKIRNEVYAQANAREMIDKSAVMSQLTRAIYAGYWEASPVVTLADRHQREVEELKERHKAAMERTRTSYEKRMAIMRENFDRRVTTMRERQAEKLDAERERRNAQISSWREAREATKQRHTLRRLMKELYTKLMSPTKTRHVPEVLRVAVIDAMRSINMDMKGLEQLADIEAALEKLMAEPMPDWDKIGKLERRRNYLEEHSASIKEQTQALLDAYETLLADKDSSGTYSQDIVEKLKELRAIIGDTSIYNMTYDQLKATSDFFRMIAHQVNTANKLFTDGREATLASEARRIMQEMLDTPAPKWLTPKKGEWAGISTMRRYIWQMLKPVNFFDMLGSDTFSKAFMDLHRGMGTYARDVEEARAKFNEIKKKYGFDKWDLNTRFEVETSNGKRVKISLGQIMSLYAYSRREQALDHLEFGGFTFAPNATYKGKYGDAEGIKRFAKQLELSINDSERYTLDIHTFAKIASHLTEEQRGFVEAMQSYLSVEMAAKGNAVSRALYDMDLFGEAFYFPMKVASEYIDSETGKVGDPKVKNKGMTKRVTPGADNPLILGDFMEVWNGHINDMALYHGLVLPMENINRLLNYRPNEGMRGAENQTERIVISADSELAKRLRTSTRSKYSVIRDYLVERFYGKEFTLSDGTTAIMDKRDAQELSHLADDLKVAELSNLIALIENAKFDHQADKVTHSKFDAFRYYAVTVEFEGQTYDLLLNVGRARNNQSYHIYDITKNRGAANRSSTDLSRPGGNAMTNSPSNSSIPQNPRNSNTQSQNSSDIEQYSTMKELIRAKYGIDAVSYIEQLLRDLNGGVRSGVPMGLVDKGLSLFKKLAVMASASVVIQQPSSIFRGCALVDPKYFTHMAGLNFRESGALWDELKQYAPVAIIKEMGGFDTGVGQTTADYITAREYEWREKPGAFLNDPNYRDSVLGYGAGKADQMAWLHLWEAVKLETHDKHREMDVHSEEFLKLAGERFEEVIIRTQVYDSSLSRSGMMRSKDTTWKMVTSFMAEPTTVVNMLVSGFVGLQRGDVKGFRRTVGSVTAALILNAVLASIVYAARDDDEEKNYGEKYVSTLVAETADAFNPLATLPYVKDIMSLVQGYEVERSDMAIYADLINAINGMGSSEKSWAEKSMNLGANIGSLFGLPTRNIYRDARGIYNVLSNADGDGSSAAGMGFAVKESMASMVPFGKLFGVKTDIPNGYQLYDAMVSGDSAHASRVLARFSTTTASNTALRTALRDKDARIRRAAQARYEGDMTTYSTLVREIKAEGIFSQDLIVSAVSAEVNAIKKDYESGAEDNADSNATAEAVEGSVYSVSDLNSQLNAGDFAEAKAIMTDIVNARMAQGKTKAQAQALVKSGITKYWKERYITAYKARNTAECKRIRALLKQTGLYGTSTEILEMTQSWVQSTTK